MNSLYACSYRCRDFAGNNVLPMILSASAFNSYMIETSIPDFNETTIKNIILYHSECVNAVLRTLRVRKSAFSHLVI